MLTNTHSEVFIEELLISASSLRRGSSVVCPGSILRQCKALITISVTKHLESYKRHETGDLAIRNKPGNCTTLCCPFTNETYQKGKKKKNQNRLLFVITSCTKLKNTQGFKHIMISGKLNICTGLRHNFTVLSKEIISYKDPFCMLDTS